MAKKKTESTAAAAGEVEGLNETASSPAGEASASSRPDASVPGRDDGDPGTVAVDSAEILQEETGKMPLAPGRPPHHVRFHDNNTTGVFDEQGRHLEEYDGTHREAVQAMADAGYDYRKASVINGTPQLEEAMPTDTPRVVDCGRNPSPLGKGVHEVDCGFTPGKKGHPAKPGDRAGEKGPPSSQ